MKDSRSRIINKFKIEWEWNCPGAMSWIVLLPPPFHFCTMTCFVNSCDTIINIFKKNSNYLVMIPMYHNFLFRFINAFSGDKMFILL